MAKQQTKRRSSGSSSGSKGSSGGGSTGSSRSRGGSGGSSNGSKGNRRSSARPHAHRAKHNLPDTGTVPEQEYQDYTLLHPGSISDTDEPDVLLDVPIVNVDEIHFELDNLHARVALHAEVLDLVKLSVGVHAELGKVELSINGVEAQALLRVRLDHVTAILDRVLTTLDRNPELVKSLGRTIEHLGSGASDALQDVGSGAGSAVEDVGEGAGGAVKDVGKGAGGAVQDVGSGAGKAAGEIGQGAGQAVGGLRQGAGQAVGGLGQGADGLLGGRGGSGGYGGGDGLTAPKMAKQVAVTLAKEIGSAASDEAKDLSLAATHKVKELGERRRQRRVEKHNATEAAIQRAEERGVDLDEVEGSGAGGRITVRDVERAEGGE